MTEPCTKRITWLAVYNPIKYTMANGVKDKLNPT